MPIWGISNWDARVPYYAEYDHIMTSDLIAKMIEDNERYKEKMSNGFRGGAVFKTCKCSDCTYAHKSADGTYLCKAGHGKNNASDYRCGYGERKKR